MKDYISLLTSLSVSSKEGRPAPHKPILLLTIISFIEAGVIENGRIFLTQELEMAFKNCWNKFVGDDDYFNCNIAMPFFFMRSEPFWELVKSQVYEERQNYNLTALKESFEYAQIDSDLFLQLQNKQFRAKCRVLLISYYLLRTHGLDAKAKAEPLRTEIVKGVYHSNYSDHSFVIGGDTKPYKDLMKSLGGYFNYGAFFGKPGWIFPLRKREEVLQAINKGPLQSAGPSIVKEKKTKKEKKVSKSHLEAIEWKNNSRGYQWAIEQLQAGVGRSVIVSGFNRRKKEGIAGFETRNGGDLTAAILSQWSRDVKK